MELSARIFSDVSNVQTQRNLSLLIKITLHLISQQLLENTSGLTSESEIFISNGGCLD